MNDSCLSNKKKRKWMNPEGISVLEICWNLSYIPRNTIHSIFVIMLIYTLIPNPTEDKKEFWAKSFTVIFWKYMKIMVNISSESFMILIWFVQWGYNKSEMKKPCVILTTNIVTVISVFIFSCVCVNHGQTCK